MDVLASRGWNDDAERVFTSGTTSRMPGWSFGGGQKRLIRVVQLRRCACVCRKRDGAESWNDDQVPAIPLGKEGRDTE